MEHPALSEAPAGSVNPEGEADIFGRYVRRRLESWGENYSLHRDMEWLGYSSKNLLQVLIEHKGEMPGRPQGYKPLEVNREAEMIELIVSGMARKQVPIACVLRAYYCGRGRRKVERLETANLLLTIAGQRPVSPRHYLILHDIGFAEVRGVLRGFALSG